MGGSASLSTKTKHWKVVYSVSELLVHSFLGLPFWGVSGAISKYSLKGLTNKSSFNDVYLFMSCLVLIN